MYASNFTHLVRSAADSFYLAVGTAVVGHIQKTARKKRNIATSLSADRGNSLSRWRIFSPLSLQLICCDVANQIERAHLPGDTSFQGGLAIDFDPTSIARLPLVSGDWFGVETSNDALL